MFGVPQPTAPAAVAAASFGLASSARREDLVSWRGKLQLGRSCPIGRSCANSRPVSGNVRSANDEAHSSHLRVSDPFDACHVHRRARGRSTPQTSITRGRRAISHTQTHQPSREYLCALKVEFFRGAKFEARTSTAGPGRPHSRF